MITTVTLNAAIDKAYYMEREIVGGTVMRVKKVQNTAGGKGLNVARVVELCGEEVLATGIVGGFNGQYLEQMLTEDGVAHDFVHVKSETRSCINILDDRFGSTEFLEPGFEILPDEESDFLDLFRRLIAKSDIVTISGSVPKGVSANIYEKMIKMVKAEGKPVILDTGGRLLASGLLAKPTVIKPNREELSALLGKAIEDVSVAATFAEQLSKSGIPYVIVSLGKDGAILACKEGVFHGKPTRKVKIKNTVGCGDSMVGGFAVALLRGYPPSQALQYAVAVATANAMSEGTGNFDPQILNGLIEKIAVKKMKIKQ